MEVDICLVVSQGNQIFFLDHLQSNHVVVWLTGKCFSTSLTLLEQEK